jgi:hypothetical protein
MLIKQISVFVENESGKIYEVAANLAENNINIRSLTLAEATDFGVLRMIVDKPEAALEALKTVGITARINEVVAVEVPDRVGGFAEVMKTIQSAGINVEYMYAFVEKNQDNAVLIFRFDNIAEAAEVLAGRGVKILKACDVITR